jgi:hypothetical protein
VVWGCTGFYETVEGYVQYRCCDVKVSLLEQLVVPHCVSSRQLKVVVMIEPIINANESWVRVRWNLREGERGNGLRTCFIILVQIIQGEDRQVK